MNVIQTQNIGAGKTEIVLARIYWMLTKMIIDKDLEVGKDFRTKFGYLAIKEGLAVL